MNSSHTIGGTEIISGDAVHIFIGPFYNDPNFILVGGACYDDGTDCYGSVNTMSVTGYSSWIARYDTTHGSAVSVSGVGSNSAPAISMSVSCNHIFISGSFSGTTSGVHFGSQSVFGNTGSPGLYVAKFHADMSDVIWIQVINTDSSYCIIDSDYSGRDYSVACNQAVALSFGSSPPPDQQYTLPRSGVFIMAGTDSDASNCPLPSFISCKCPVESIFQRIRVSYPADYHWLVPFGV